MKALCNLSELVGLSQSAARQASCCLSLDSSLSSHYVQDETLEIHQQLKKIYM